MESVEVVLEQAVQAHGSGADGGVAPGVFGLLPVARALGGGGDRRYGGGRHDRCRDEPGERCIRFFVHFLHSLGRTTLCFRSPAVPVLPTTFPRRGCDRKFSVRVPNGAGGCGKTRSSGCRFREEGGIRRGRPDVRAFSDTRSAGASRSPCRPYPKGWPPLLRLLRRVSTTRLRASAGRLAAAGPSSASPSSPRRACRRRGSRRRAGRSEGGPPR